MFKNINAILRTVSLLLLVAIGGWWTMFLRDKVHGHEVAIEERDKEIKLLSNHLQDSEVRIDELDETVEQQVVEISEKAQEIERLDLSVTLLKVNHRVARIVVLDQQVIEGETAANGEPRVQTKIRFSELGPDDVPLEGSIETTIEGSRVYVESWVIKFEDEFVEQGDHLRGSSLVLFKRLFGDQQEPASGTTIDAVGSKPRIYGDEDGPSPEHAELWERFWDYANDPAAAAKKGVRAMHGEAPFTELRPGGSYKVELRASDGLTISPE
ncbi:MAG: hypothetical protein ACI835_002651 [Planctomycetota bacterium]